MSDICLVTMPFDAIEQPSIALGLLASAAKRRGLDVRQLYPKFWFADLIGFERYHMLAAVEKTTNFVAEWIFARSAFPGCRTSVDPPLTRVKILTSHGSGKPPDLRATAFEARAIAEDFLVETARKILNLKPKIVGCTSTFRQHCPSLALLRTIREMDPLVITMLGGADCEGEMGLANKRCFPWIDFVVSGEADNVFPELCALLLEQGGQPDPGKLPMGVITASNLETFSSASGEDSYRATVDDLDSLPFPDYDEYLAECKKIPEEEGIYPFIAMETSRGCWWGQKHPCAFCGLNGTSHRFRMKSLERVLSELDYLHKRYNTGCTVMTDNILSMDYFKTVLPRLASGNGPSYFYFWEVKANLREQHVRMLAKAGVRQIQAGIESMDDQALKLLNKGVTVIQNVAILKYAMENGINVSWNFLTGIPGEDDAWYEKASDWLPSIFHLQPPVSINDLRFDRFSRYFRDPERYNLDLKPYAEYHAVYPLPEKDIASMAYFFENITADNAPRPGRAKLIEVAEQWQTLFKQYHSVDKRISLTVSERDGESVITDTRPCAVQNSIRLTGLLHAVYSRCLTPCKKNALNEQMRSCSDGKYGEADVEEALRELAEKRLVLVTDSGILSLALRGPVRPLLTKKEFLLGNISFSQILDSFLQY